MIVTASHVSFLWSSEEIMKSRLVYWKEKLINLMMEFEEKWITGSRLLNISDNVGHASFVTQESCKLARFGWVILGESFHCINQINHGLVDNYK